MGKIEKREKRGKLSQQCHDPVSVLDCDQLLMDALTFVNSVECCKASWPPPAGILKMPLLEAGRRSVAEGAPEEV